MRAAARAEGASRDTIRRRQDGKLSKPEWPLGTPRYRFASLNLRRPRLRPIKAGSGNVRNWQWVQSDNATRLVVYRLVFQSPRSFVGVD